jgi:hypothetical protein
MPFVGDKGGQRAPDINRAKLLDGDEYAKVAQARPVLSAATDYDAAATERGRRHTGRGRRQAYSFGGPVDEPEREAPTSPHTAMPDANPQRVVDEKRAGWARSGKMELSTVNSYGFASRSQFFFPEAYRPVDTKFWKPMSQEETADIHLRQAQANLKAGFIDEKYMPVAQTEADSQYMDATSKRNLSMRRRRKPMNYDERKKDEEIQRKLPLVRRYTTGESAFRESSQIVQSGPLDTPILVSGLPTRKDNATTGPAPGKLRRRRRPRREQPAYDENEPRPEITLPTFDPKSAPRVRLAGRGHNSFGLKSRSEMMYPEAYKEISSIYWRRMSNEDRGRVMHVQARAMEKVGYERGTEKQFIEEIEPDAGWVAPQNARTDDTERVGSGISGEGVIVFLVVLAALALAGYGIWRNFGELFQ